MRRRPRDSVLALEGHSCAFFSYAVLLGVLTACASPGPAFTAPPAAAPVALPRALPAQDTSFALPTSKDEVSLELHPRVEFRESVAADSDERTALAASVVLTLPPNRAAVRKADVSLAIKRNSTGQVAETKKVTYARDTRDEVLTVALGPLSDGAYDIDIHTVAHIDVLDDDWTVMTDTREVTEHAPLVVGAEAGKHEQNKAFEFHFANDLAAPVDTERATLERDIKAIDALLAAHPNATARVDCWTSSSGEERTNRALAERRCEWFKTNVWGRLSSKTKDPLAAVPHSSSELAAEERSRDVKVQSRNRVVRLRVRWVQ
jgi:outer membrane protein OmpA-like peptidoglycan-associated protein